MNDAGFSLASRL